MQIFEVIELKEFPFFKTIEITNGEIVGGIINDENNHKVFLLVDHDEKRIYVFNGRKSPLKLQIYGGILAHMLRKQLKLFYRVYSLNKFEKNDEIFQEILERPLGAGRAKIIDENDFSQQLHDSASSSNITIFSPRFKSAIEIMKEYPIPEGYKRIFLIIGGTIYSEEEEVESLLSEERISFKETKMGRLNDGFTFFKDMNYAIRLIVHNKTIQGIELFIREDEEIKPLEIETPIIYEERFSKEGNIDDLIKAFQIPDTLPEEMLENDENIDENTI
ncbi:MAG: hypothetical protein ACTSO4_07330 [Promethearchaeota archaeon]